MQIWKFIVVTSKSHTDDAEWRKAMIYYYYYYDAELQLP